MSLLLLACAAPVLQDGLVELSAVEYRVDWRTDGVELYDQGFALVTDSGWTVTVDEAWLVHNSVAMVPCSYGLAAGHALDEDPSTMTEAYIEDLSVPAEHSLASFSFESEAYCEFFLLDARHIGEGELTDLTLVVRGQAVRGRELRILDLASDASRGEILALDELDVYGEGDAARITVQRDLLTMFDGVDFSSGDEVLSEAILDRLFEDQIVSMELY